MRRIVGLLMLVLAVSGCASTSIAPMPKVPKVSVVPTQTTLADYSNVSLPKVPGTTTTTAVGLEGGNASIHGRVLLGGGPVGGANIRIERFEGDNPSGSADLTSDGTGNFSLDNVHGGRYRVRAWRAPDAAMPQAQIFFLGAGEHRSADLALQGFGGGTTVSASVSPDPPILGSVSSLVVYVSTRGVDANGVARSIPIGGIPVTLLVGSGRSLVTANPTNTAANGRALFSFQCTALDRQGVSVIVPGSAATPLNVSPCELPPTTTTTTDPNATTTTAGPVIHDAPGRSTTTTSTTTKKGK